MILSCDLHIHTAISPCSESDMTPGNIVAMSKLKGLDVIAITDHQSCGNVSSAMKISKAFGIIVIPGMELETSEEIHLVCLFTTLANALKFEKIIKSRMPNIKNREDIFGEQWYYDENDEKLTKEENLLLVPSDISYEEAFLFVRENSGICYPAHIDRESYSVLKTFGEIPNDSFLNIAEISAKCNENEFRASHPELSGYVFIRSSDAHSLGAILEQGMMVEIAQLDEDEKTISHIFKALRH